MGLFKRFQAQIFNLGIYFSASLIPMILSLVTNPLIAKNMSPTDYATIGYYQAFNTLIIPFINYYLLHYYTKKFFEISDNQRIILKATLFKALIFLSFFLALLSVLLLYLYTIFFNAESQIPFFPYAVLSVLTLPLTGIYALILVEYRMQRESIRFFRLSVTNGVISIGIIFLLVVVFKYGALGKLTATLCAALIIFLYVLVKNRKLLCIRFNKAILKDAVKFCSPLVAASMLTFFSTGYDRILLEREGKIIELGYYVVGLSIAGYINIFSNSINDTFQPDIFQCIVQKKYKKCVKVIFLKIVILSLFVGIFILLAPFIVAILTANRYVNSTPYAVIISLSAITSMLYYSFSQVTIALGYTSITLINKIIGSILCVIMYTIFIFKWSATGAAWGTVFSFLLFFIGNMVLVFFKYKRKGL